jgi:Zn-dependent protease with chaperone function
VENANVTSVDRPLAVERWPTEIPLLVFVAIAAVGIWLLLAVSILGLAYALVIALVLFFAHVAFVTHLRGSAVKLGPEQFPELHARVVELARRAGLASPPDAYLLQAGGSLNALATKLFRGRMIVLFSDLLEACGDDAAARDMVIGHELGHLKSGHLDWHLAIAPGMFVPFLGAAYSRAREYTCDRWGAALCGDRAGAARGLAILAAGGRHGPRVNLRAFGDQQKDLDTGWMTLGRWLSGYPPLAARVTAVEPALAPGGFVPVRGTVRALLIVAAFVLVPTTVGFAAAMFWVAKMKPLLASTAVQDVSDPGFGLEEEEDEQQVPVVDVPAATRQAEADLAELAEVVRDAGEPILDGDGLGAAWSRLRPGRTLPFDPFDGLAYGVTDQENGNVRLFSSGPDGAPFTEDDIGVDVETAARPAPGANT